MAVVVTASFEGVNGLYVPFRGVNRYSGAIGTLHLHAHATGDSGGGTVTINFQARRIMFGFHGLFVPRASSTNDNLASGVAVLLSFHSAGNERLLENHLVIERKKETVDSTNVNVFSADDYKLVIEPDQVSDTTTLSFVWGTNTDTKVYHAKMFLTVYDLEALSKSGRYVPEGGFLNS